MSRRTVIDEDQPIVEVGVATEVNLLSVNDAEETFKVALLIHTHYKLPKILVDPDLPEREKNLLISQIKKFSPDPDAPDGEFQRVEDYDLFSPVITMVNCVDTQFEEFVRTVRFKKKTGDLWVSFYNTCTIYESLELEKFPFDRQLFRVTFKSANANLRNWKLDTDILDFTPSRKEKPTEEDLYATQLVACELKNWLMASFHVEYFPEDDDPASLTKGEFQITIRAERDPRFYFFNFYFIMYLIVAANVALVSVSPDASGDRHAISLTLLLTLVAFKFVLIEGTPKVGYLTYMDKYVILSYIFAILAVIENIFIAPFTICFFEGNTATCDELIQKELALDYKEYDGYFHMVFIVIWTFANFVMFIMCFVPSLVRDTWQQVDDGQIGETEETVKRLRTIEDGNKNEEEMMKRLKIVKAPSQVQPDVITSEVPAPAKPAEENAVFEVTNPELKATEVAV